MMGDGWRVEVMSRVDIVSGGLGGIKIRIEEEGEVMMRGSLGVR